MKKVKLFTHTDLDGVSCDIVLRQHFKAEYLLETDFCGYSDLNDRIIAWFNTNEGKMFGQDDILFITDIGPSPNVIDKIEQYKQQQKFHVALLDHHSTPALLEAHEKYKWVQVIPEYEDGRKACGTSLLIDFLQDDDVMTKLSDYYNIKYNDGMVNFAGIAKYVDLVRLWDTFDWQTLPDGDLDAGCAISLSFLQGQLPREDFIPAAHAYINCYNESIGWAWYNTDLDIIRQQWESLDNKIKYYESSMILKEYMGYMTAVIFDDSYEGMSMACSMLLKRRLDIDFITVINFKRMTFEFRAYKDGINLAKDIAPKFGGGGHPKASGAQIDEFTKSKVAHMIIDQYVTYKL